MDDAGIRQQLGSVPGLDVELGLVYLQGRFDPYCRILAKFAQQHLGDGARIRQLLDQGKLPEAERLSHSVKGSAATLGATQLHEAAARLNQTLKHEPLAPALMDQIATFEMAMDGLCHRIICVLDQTGQRADDAAVGSDAGLGDFRLLSASLLPLLEAADMAVQALARQHLQLLSRRLGEDYPAFQNCLDAFDFEGALTVLRRY